VPTPENDGSSAQRLGPILPTFNMQQKLKLKYAFAVGMYKFQKARVKQKK
jgi:hypothetical protein